MNLQRVKQDIRIGLSTRIYMCTASLWWTHLESDLEEATRMGIAFKKRVEPLKLIIESQNISPIGAPLKINDNPARWIKTTERLMPGQFGKDWERIFMKAHHQNEQAHFYNKWIKYKELLK
jgi:hypothetical protein